MPDIMQPNEHAQKVMLYSFGLQADVSAGTFDVTLRMPPACRVLRPTRIMTNVARKKTVFLTSLIIGGEDQLMARKDAYEWSAEHYAEVLKDALRSLGCASDIEFERRQDAGEFQDMSLPDPFRVDMPNIQANDPVRMAGMYIAELPEGKKFAMSIIGYGLT